MVKDIPEDWGKGLRQCWHHDIVSGFLVFLLALPLSLGIAKASEFPAAMGVLTAMIGGLVVTLFAGSRLTIKGPAAGLITVCSGAVLEFGGGTEGWQMALGAVVVAAFFQIICGFLRVGSLADFFPPSVVHGMLAAIGLIIFAKQVHVVLGIDPITLKGLDVFGLYAAIPHSIASADIHVTIVGITSLLIVFLFPLIRLPVLRQVPAPVLVLIIAIPIAAYYDFKHTEPAFDMVHIGNFWGNIGINVDFSMLGSGVFWKYVVMFFFINSLESLLTVKAIDGLDPWKRVSDPNRDLVGVGVGNALSGVLGGLPMISEVARSSANIMFGARTRWSNFFHGSFLLVAMWLFIPLIEMIPNAALAALLIAVGYRLASPHEFFRVYRIGPEQLVIFIATVFMTLATDLLKGVAFGIAVKLLINMMNGVRLRNTFCVRLELTETLERVIGRVEGAAVFSNLLNFKRKISRVNRSIELQLDFSRACLIDHTFVEYLDCLSAEFMRQGGALKVTGMQQLRTLSSHPQAARKQSII